MMQRRQFLGAAATLSGMPIPATDIAADGGTDDTDEGGHDPDYGRETVVKTSGGLEVFADGNHETKLGSPATLKASASPCRMEWGR